MTALVPRPRTAERSAAALVDAAIDGDERAWQELCEAHEAGVRAVAHARLRDHHAAEDVVQETLLRAWTCLHQVKDAARLGAWLKTIAANVAVDHVRRQRATAPLEAAHDTAAPLPPHDELVVAREEAEELHARLDQLREVDRRALWQRDGHGVSVGELAEDLGMTTGSVRVMLARARRQVRDGYGLVAAPLVGLWARWRARWAGLGDAVPVAVAAPAVVVAVVAGVAGVAMPTDAAPAPRPPAASVAATPAQPTADDTVSTRAVPTPQQGGAQRAEHDPPWTPATAGPTDGADRGPSLDLPGGSGTTFSDAPPTDDDPDADPAGPPAGPVDGVELYLEETGLGDWNTGELGEDCAVCS